MMRTFKSTCLTCGSSYTLETHPTIRLDSSTSSVVLPRHSVPFVSLICICVIAVGEIRNGEVIGFHNMITFFYEEKAGHVDYKGYILPRRRGGNHPDGHERVLTLQFAWKGKLKEVGSSFIGVSPEFGMYVLSLIALLHVCDTYNVFKLVELALYTLCFAGGGEDNHIHVCFFLVFVLRFIHSLVDWRIRRQYQMLQDA